MSLRPSQPTIKALPIFAALGAIAAGIDPRAAEAALSFEGKPPRPRAGDRPCRICGKPKVALWRKKGVDLCGPCNEATKTTQPAKAE